MPVFHCPLCPLIFEYRTEVEHHLRNEHRSRAEEEADMASELAAVSYELSSERLDQLVSARSGAAVTILLGTTPAPSMTSLDVARLRRLAYRARRRVAAEPGSTPSAIEYRLARAVAAAEGAATHEGLAILVNSEHLAIFHLPFPPADRVVVDPTFATRDLEVALRCYPRYRLVVLGDRPRLFEGRGLHLAEVDTPTDRPSPGHSGGRSGDREAASSHPRDGRRSVRPERWAIGSARRRTGVRLADESVTDRATSHGDLPLVVAGDGRWRAQFRRQSRHAASIAGEVAGIRSHDPAPRLAELAQPHLGRLMQKLQAEAVTELECAESNGSVAWGLAAVWSAVHDGTADHLWIERTYARPGRVAADAPVLSIVGDPDEPGVNDDLVDDLIQLAQRRGLGVDLVVDGALNRPEPVAARLRTASPVGEAAFKAAI